MRISPSAARSTATYPTAGLRALSGEPLFPGLPPAEYEELKASIARRGIATRLCVTSDGLVICGHARYRVAVELGLLSVPVVVVYFTSLDAERLHVLRENFGHRRLRPAQRCAIVTRPDLAGVQALIDRQARAQLTEGTFAGTLGADGRLRSADFLAEFARVSASSISNARRMWRETPLWMSDVARGIAGVDSEEPVDRQADCAACEQVGPGRSSCPRCAREAAGATAKGRKVRKGRTA